MTRRLVPLLLLLICTTVVARAQAPAEPDEALVNAGWTGDAALFEYSGGFLRYRNDGIAGTATLYKTYERDLSEYLFWETQLQFDAVPTSGNTFTWTLFFEKSPQGLLAYGIEPDARGGLVVLVRYSVTPDYHTYTDRRILDRIILDNPAFAWSQLTLQALFTTEKGLQMGVILPGGKSLLTDPVPPKGGELIGRMQLSTRFSAQKKLSYAWTLPTVSADPRRDSSPLSYTEIELSDEGRIRLLLDRPVRLDRASAEVDGTAVALSPGHSSQELLLTLPFAFTAGKRYAVRVRDLLDLQGQPHELEFDLETEAEEADDESRKVEGIFISEVMTSPPESGPLAGTKYIELYNNTPQTIPLSALQLRYRTQLYKLPATSLAPYSYALLYPIGSRPSGTGVQVPMPEFSALSGTFYLSLEEVGSGAVLDDLHFSPARYGEGVPTGGASVERVAFRPAEWRRSIAPSGGTPGTGTAMKAHKAVEKGALILNELMLSPETTGEKYIELYNTSSAPLDLSDLYLSYRNSPTASPKSWLLVTEPYTIPAGGYAVLCPYPEALPRIHSFTDPETYIERIDFPALSSTYTEVELRSHRGWTLIDRAIYRRQWLGDSSGDRSKHALERVSPDTDGTQRPSWSRSAVGGTPGVRNQPLSGSPTLTAEWPEDPHLSLEDLLRLTPQYRDLLTLELFSLTGGLILRLHKKEAEKALHELLDGSSALPTSISVVRATITPPQEDLQPLTYTAKWIHIPRL